MSFNHLDKAQREPAEPPKVPPDWVVDSLKQELVQLNRSRWPDLFGRRRRRLADLQGDIEKLILDYCRLAVSDCRVGLVSQVLNEASRVLSESLSALRHWRERLEHRVREISDETLVLSKPEIRLLTQDIVPRQEDLDRFYTLDRSVEGSSEPVQPDAELRQCIEDIRARGVAGLGHEVMPELLSQCAQYCRSRFESDFQLHPRSFDVFSSLADSAAAASWLAFHAAPLLSLSQRPRANAGAETLSILELPNPRSRGEFIRTVDRQLRSHLDGDFGLDVVVSEDLERIALRTVRVGLSLSDLQTVGGDCKRSYEEQFVMEGGLNALESLSLVSGKVLYGVC